VAAVRERERDRGRESNRSIPCLRSKGYILPIFIVLRGLVSQAN
jgi:hypothetical protein